MRKTTIVVAVLVLAFTVNAIAATYSNPVGFVKVDLKRDAYNMVSVPMVVPEYALNDSDPNVRCVGEMFAAVLYGTMNMGTASLIYEYNPATTGFFTYWLFDSLGTYMGGIYDGKWIEGSAPTTKSLTQINGYYVFRTADLGASVEQAVILGDVEVADSVIIEIDDGYNMLCYPYPVSVGANSGGMPTLAEGAHGTMNMGTADLIYRLNATGGFDTLWMFDSAGTYMGGIYDGDWIEGSAPSTATIGEAEGFYYYRTPTQGIFDWVVERPYTVD